MKYIQVQVGKIGIFKILLPLVAYISCIIIDLQNYQIMMQLVGFITMLCRLLIGNKEIVCLFILLLLIVKLTYYDLLIQKCMCVSYPVQY